MTLFKIDDLVDLYLVDLGAEYAEFEGVVRVLDVIDTDMGTTLAYRGVKQACDDHSHRTITVQGRTWDGIELDIVDFVSEEEPHAEVVATSLLPGNKAVALVKHPPNRRLVIRPIVTITYAEGEAPAFLKAKPHAHKELETLLTKTFRTQVEDGAQVEVNVLFSDDILYTKLK